MEKKIFVEDLELHQEVSSLFQIQEVDLRKTRSGDYYIAMMIGDRTGRVPTRIWSATEELFHSFLVGEILGIKGIRVSDFNGTLQFSINKEDHEKLAIYPLADFDGADYLAVTPKDRGAMLLEIKRAIEEMEKEELKNLLLSFFQDKAFRRSFSDAPAAVTHHHTYCGGLLEHTVSVLRISGAMAKEYEVDKDLLSTGAILHDIGKMKSYTFQPTITMTTEGQLFSHIVLGSKMLHEKIEREGLQLGREDYYRLQHMILSHHGKKEWGSPVEPATLEALILHHVDYLDATAHKYERALENDLSKEGEWSTYHSTIGNRLFLGLDDKQG